jgi:hypothetical protein
VDWLDQIKGMRLEILAARLGLAMRDRHIVACLACGARTRSRSDGRPGAVFRVGRVGWQCGHCGETGDGLRLAGWALLGERLERGSRRWGELRARLVEIGIVEDSETPAPRVRRGLSEAQALQATGRAPVVEVVDEAERDAVTVAEVRRLWADCRPAREDPQVVAWLHDRGIDAELLTSSMVRALPDGPLPRWATAVGRPWSVGWRAIVPGYDARGELVTLRARWVRSGEVPPRGLKAAAVRGAPASGAVLACGLARQVLADGVPQWWPVGVPLRVVVVEGEPDWLTWVRMAGEADATAPAVIGVWSGSLTRAVVDRIPDGAHVAEALHDDSAGRAYAARLAELSAGRFQIQRIKIEGEHGPE